MINLRFHIVSITAVFLSLAIGIFMGTSLLNGATVERLEDRQTSLRDKIAAREAENEALRSALRTVDRDGKAFTSQLLPLLVRGTVDASVLVVAARGVDPDVVRSAEAALVASGATSYGTVWVDQRLDLADPDALDAAERAVGVTPLGNAASRRAAVLSVLGGALAGVPVQVRGTSTTASTTSTTTTTTTLAAGPDAGSLQVVPPDVALDAWNQLRSAGLVDWTLGDSGGVLPGATLRVVVVSGEGAELSDRRFLRPLIEAIVGARSGSVVAAETMDRRGAVDDALRALDTTKPQRGAFITPIREDGSLDGRLTTVDDLDRAEGQLAVVFGVRDLPTKVGDYGILAGTDGPYPPARP